MEHTDVRDASHEEQSLKYRIRSDFTALDDGDVRLWITVISEGGEVYLGGRSMGNGWRIRSSELVEWNIARLLDGEVGYAEFRHAMAGIQVKAGRALVEQVRELAVRLAAL